MCGSLRYGAVAEPIDAGYCHCSMCQKLSGAPLLPWASFATESFRYRRGSPKIYTSSSHGQREFCADCGSQIAFRTTDSESTVELNLGTLDDPAAVSPQYHIWCASRIPWFDTADSLPRYPGSER